MKINRSGMCVNKDLDQIHLEGRTEYKNKQKWNMRDQPQKIKYISRWKLRLAADSGGGAWY